MKEDTRAQSSSIPSLFHSYVACLQSGRPGDRLNSVPIRLANLLVLVTLGAILAILFRQLLLAAPSAPGGQAGPPTGRPSLATRCPMRCQKELAKG